MYQFTYRDMIIEGTLQELVEEISVNEEFSKELIIEMMSYDLRHTGLSWADLRCAFYETRCPYSSGEKPPFHHLVSIPWQQWRNLAHAEAWRKAFEQGGTDASIAVHAQDIIWKKARGVADTIITTMPRSFKEIVADIVKELGVELKEI